MGWNKSTAEGTIILWIDRETRWKNQEVKDSGKKEKNKDIYASQ